MTIREYVVAGMIALGALAGCKGETEYKTLGIGKETVVRVDDTIKAYADVDRNGSVDFYCKTDVTRHEKRMGPNRECFASDAFVRGLSEPVRLEVGFGPYPAATFALSNARTMGAEVEARVNAEYATLNSLKD
ncbi:MAG TPA: hypothetical protein VJC39_00110 [Candidatus Nanoarchaeia archaeon]|nr:hypothetical protein [Candidatus Nanoarchaeia archaeon]